MELITVVMSILFFMFLYWFLWRLVEFRTLFPSSRLKNLGTYELIVTKSSTDNEYKAELWLSNPNQMYFKATGQTKIGAKNMVITKAWKSYKQDKVVYHRTNKTTNVESKIGGSK